MLGRRGVWAWWGSMTIGQDGVTGRYSPLYPAYPPPHTPAARAPPSTHPGRPVPWSDSARTPRENPTETGQVVGKYFSVRVPFPTRAWSGLCDVSRGTELPAPHGPREQLIAAGATES